MAVNIAISLCSEGLFKAKTIKLTIHNKMNANVIIPCSAKSLKGRL